MSHNERMYFKISIAIHIMYWTLDHYTVDDTEYIIIEYLCAKVELGFFTPSENIKIMPCHRPIIKYPSREFFSYNQYTIILIEF
jgi:hypothetical protein